MSNTANLKKDYLERIVPALQKEFNYSTVMQVPVLKKIVINQGLGEATADKKIIETAINELTAITGQKAVATLSRKDISNFKLRKKMPIGVMVTLRRERMYEFLERLVRVSLPRIRDFKGIESKLDGRGNYTLGIQEQIIFPEINIDSITKIMGMNITFVTSAKTDEEGLPSMPKRKNSLKQKVIMRHFNCCRKTLRVYVCTTVVKSPVVPKDISVNSGYPVYSSAKWLRLDLSRA